MITSKPGSGVAFASQPGGAWYGRNMRRTPGGESKILAGVLSCLLLTCKGFAAAGDSPPSHVVDAGAAEAGSSGATGPCAADLASDAKNCGACGHDCGPSACLSSKCDATRVAAGQAHPTSIAIDAANVYWTNRVPSTGSVMQCAIDGCKGLPQELATGQGSPDYLVTSSWAGEPAVVWATPDDASVNAARPLGSARNDPPIKKGGYPELRAIGAGGGDFFIASGSLILKCRVDDLANQCPFVTSGDAAGVGAIAVDAEEGVVYWTIPDGVASASVAAPAAGRNLVVAGASLYALGLDAQNVYATQRTDPGGLISAAKSHPDGGGQPRQIDPGRHGPRGLAVDGAFAYYVTAGTGAKDGMLIRVGIRDASVLVLADGLDNPSGVAVHDAYVYWTNSGTTDADGSVMRVPK
jgi:hypothetical protein